MPYLHQAVASFVPFDAVSEAARAFKRMLWQPGAPHRFSGYRPGSILAEGIHRSLRREAIRFDELGSGSAKDVILYHCSTDSRIADWLLLRPERVVVYYHNLTPAHFLQPYDPRVAERLRRARRQLVQLASVAEVAVAPSEFSMKDLRDAGYRKVSKLPYPLGFASLPVASPPSRTWGPSKSFGGEDTAVVGTSRRKKVGVVARSMCHKLGPPLLRRTDRSQDPHGADGSRLRRDDKLRLLFVGRITPNKAQHQVLRLARLLSQVAAREVEPILVGATHLPLYERYVRALSDRLGFGPHPFVGPVSLDRLRLYYRTADYFVSFSRHEGFFVPAVEAMASGLPLVALDRGAVGETVGSGGVLVPEDDVATFAGIVAELEDSPDLRDSLVEAGAARACELFDTRAVEQGLVSLLSP